MFDKLAVIEERFQTLEQELIRAIADHQRIAQLGRERADLEPIVTVYRRYRAMEDQLQQALALRGSGDEEIEQLALSEIAQLEPQLRTLREELKTLLLPRDARDRRNVIVEIRAGTGGDEAGLFAANLFRMYSRYAETRRWAVETVLTAGPPGWENTCWTAVCTVSVGLAAVAVPAAASSTAMMMFNIASVLLVVVSPS